jgi:hypothetical protein
VGREALRKRHTNGMEVRKKRPRAFKKQAQGVQASPLDPLSVAPWLLARLRPAVITQGAAVGLAVKPRALARSLQHFPYMERAQGVIDGVPRGPVGPPGPLE